MKNVIKGLVAGAMLFTGAAAFAQAPAAGGTAPAPAPAAGAAAAPSEADCKLTDIDKSIDDAISAIKASPAYGHAGGHYAKAEKDLTNTKKQLETGCKAWLKGGEKSGKGGKKAK